MYSVLPSKNVCETMIHLMKKMSAQIVIRVMVEVEYEFWNSPLSDEDTK